MLPEAKSPLPWDLADSKKKRSRFSGDSFYIVIDGFQADTVRQTSGRVKAFLLTREGVRVRGPKALPTERRRYMVMREMKDGASGQHVYLSQPLRYRNILLVIHPTSSTMADLINYPVTSEVNIRIEPYQNQYDLREDRR